jgi:uncharacterized phage protein (TIGR01671 family)
MREIKFRAWDKSCNKMRGLDGVKDCFSLRSDGFCNEDYILMQFIGLTDKNGVEIFEFDIVKNPQGKIGEVVFHEGKFCLKSFRKNDTIWYMPLDIGFMKNKEVIGNKFENPELL